MIQTDFLWNSFAASGNIELYLEYKGYHQEINDWQITNQQQTQGINQNEHI